VSVFDDFFERVIRHSTPGENFSPANDVRRALVISGILEQTTMFEHV